MAAENVAECNKVRHTAMHMSQHSKLCFPYGSKRCIHPHHPKVAIVVGSNHNLVNCCNAVHCHVRLGRAAQAPARGEVLVLPSHDADVPILCPRQNCGRVLA
jgi:hypothetical protein